MLPLSHPSFLSFPLPSPCLPPSIHFPPHARLPFLGCTSPAAAGRRTAGASSCSTLAGGFGAPQGAAGLLLADLQGQVKCSKLHLIARKVEELLGQEASQKMGLEGRKPRSSWGCAGGAGREPWPLSGGRRLVCNYRCSSTQIRLNGHRIKIQKREQNQKQGQNQNQTRRDHTAVVVFTFITC